MNGIPEKIKQMHDSPHEKKQSANTDWSSKTSCNVTSSA